MMNWIDYREKLGLGFNDSRKEKMFANKIANRLYEFFQAVSRGACWNYASLNGIISPYFTEVGEEVPFQASLPDIVENMKKEDTAWGLVSKYIALLNVVDDEDYRGYHTEFLNILKESLAEVKIGYETITDEDGIFIFPKGAKELDDALVSEPLEWLQEYPHARTAWIKALKEYSEQTDENASDIADKFRKALEAFFQEFFDSGKSLENYKSEYGNYLKDKGVPAELRGNFQKLLDGYADYVNSYAKHHDKTSQNVLEYIMYQTGNIMRLLITLKNEG